MRNETSNFDMHDHPDWRWQGVQAAEKGKPLDDAQCKAAWTIVSPNGAAISQGKPVPSIIDWTMVDLKKTQPSTPTSSRQAARPVG